MTKGVAITVKPEQVQEIALEMTLAEYLQTILLLDKNGNGVLVSLQTPTKGVDR